ncbi:solute carrier family 22 member 13-like [Lagopus leucura]|uniref:solute carrier family 22 member 13-like n=1 Tax=Lagopus leucura TaxID=30410 RepID=UPI001C67C1B1|nr:solute carrier family 22 member 13-like [Lagopus leucura]
MTDDKPEWTTAIAGDKRHLGEGVNNPQPAHVPESLETRNNTKNTRQKYRDEGIDPPERKAKHQAPHIPDVPGTPSAAPSSPEPGGLSASPDIAELLGETPKIKADELPRKQTTVIQEENVQPSRGLNDTQKCSNGWVYPTAQQPSLLTEFDLVCDRKNLNDISQSIYMLGMFLGAMIFGLFSDRFGRRPALLISILLEGLFGVAIALVPHFYVYLAFRCVVGASVSGIMMTLLALVTEWVGVSYRPQAVLLSHCCFAIGQMILAGLSYGIPNWRLLQTVGSAPIFILFLFIWVLPESARWLVTKGKIEEAKKYFKKAASINKRTIPPEMLDQLKGETQTKSGSILDLLRKKHLLRMTLIIMCAWFMDSLVYYGLSLNVTGFGLDIYLTQLAFGAVELPGRISCIYLLQWFGRKKVQAVLLLLAGLMCLIIVGIPEDQAVAITVLAVIGKFAACASFSTSYIYAAELFPTVIR